MSRFKKLRKIVGRVLLALLASVLLCLLVIQLPPVQSYLTGRLVRYLQDKLQTEVRIESIRLRLPQSVVLRGVYLEDLREDTLAHVSELAVGIRPLRLLQKRIHFSRLTLRSATLYLRTGSDSLSNFGFITEAFGNPADTVKTVREAESSPTAWALVIDRAKLSLRDVRMQYLDVPNATDVEVDLRRLEAGVPFVDLQDNRYHVASVAATGMAAKVILGRIGATARVEASAQPADYQIEAASINLEKTAILLQLEEQAFDAQWEALRSGPLNFQLRKGETDLQLPGLVLEKGRFRYNDGSAVTPAAAFDPRHFDFQELAFDIRDVAYQAGAFRADVRTFSGRDLDAFVLQNLQGKIDYAPEKFVLEDVALRTDRSRLNIRLGRLDFGLSGLAEPSDDWQVASDWDISQLSVADLLYFYPDLAKIPFFQAKTPALRSVGQVSGTLDDLSIERFSVQNRDVRVEATGRLLNVHDPGAMALDLQIPQLSGARPGIAAALPPGALPAYMQLPDQASFRGSVRGRLDSLRLSLAGGTRRGPVPLVSHLAVEARLENVADPDRLQFAVMLDSFYLTRADLLAYLPPDLLPETVLLPESFRVEGRASGRPASFSTDLKLQTFRGSHAAVLQVTGQLDSIREPRALWADMEIGVRGLNRPEMAALLPATWLPDSMQWPDISDLSGRIQGSMDSLGADLRFFTDWGEGRLNGLLVNRESYALQFRIAPLRPALLFEPGYLDTLLGFSPAPLAVRLDLTGQGLDTSRQTRADLQLNIWQNDQAMSSGLLLEAAVAEQKLNAELQTRQAGLKIESGLTVDYGLPLVQTDFFFQLRELDLQRLEVSVIPFQLSGTIETHLEGWSSDTFSGRLMARDWAIFYDSSRQVVDSLLLTARMDNGKNEFNLTSDLMTARLAGSFRFSRTGRALRQQFAHYWDGRAVDSLVGTTPDDFDFRLEILRPEVLTMGYIPGLQELAPLSSRMTYDNREAQLRMNLSVPHLRWSDVQLDTLEWSARAATDSFSYQLDTRNVRLQQIARVPAFRGTGRYSEEQLTTAFVLLDANDRKRFDLTSHLQRVDTQFYEWRLAPRQLLDYQWWQVSPGNAIVYQDGQVSVEDWRLFREQESMEIREVSKDRLKILFSHFDLDLVANVLDQQDPYVGGVIDGTVTLDHLLETAQIGANFSIDSLSFFAAQLGNLTLDGRSNRRQLQAALQLQGQGHDLTLTGKYEWENRDSGVDFQLDLNRIDLEALEPLAFGQLEKVRGALKGKMHIGGSIQKPLLEGEVRFDSTVFDVALLNTELSLGNQPVIFDHQGVTFQDLEIFDAQGHRAVLSQGVRTEDYRSFVLNTIMRAENFVVLNTTSADNDLYYGRLAVDATAQLRGSLSQPDIEVFARPRRGSQLTYVYRLGTPQVASPEGIVVFVSDDEPERGAAEEELARVSEELNLQVSVRIEVTDELTFKAITNPLTNDFFEGRAKGNLNYRLFPTGRMEMTGLLEMVEGRYMFTYQDVVRRKFSVESGSTIRWTGDPLSPEMNIRVLYEVQTSPFPLLAEMGVEESHGSGKEVFRVILTMTGTPSKTDIHTSIVYPQIPANSNSPNIQTAIQRINRDPSRQNTQAFALILFNGFMGAGNTQRDFQVSDLDLESNISNLITKQLNNLANRYIQFVDLDIDLENYERRGGGFEDTQADIRVGLRKQFLNDRLSIRLEGVASAQTDQQSTNTTYMLDNLTFEYDLTPDGRFRIKVYNRRDYDDIISGNSLKVGGALVFSRDFNEIRLFGKKKSR